MSAKGSWSGYWLKKLFSKSATEHIPFDKAWKKMPHHSPFIYWLIFA